MLLNAPPPPAHQFGAQNGPDSGPAAGANSASPQSRPHSSSSQNLQRRPPLEQGHEGASEIYSLVLTGGPKWGFRIKQLNDNRVIVSRIDKGPAEKSGLRVYDELLSVNNVQLSNQPRSLLLYDYPEQEQQHILARSGAGGGDKTPLLAPDTAGADSTGPLSARDGPAAGSPARNALYLRAQIELSKLDFAYQLIKHSSASNNNKLMLTIRRFLSAAYARASALAATNTLAAWNFSSSHEYRQQAMNELEFGQPQPQQQQQRRRHQDRRRQELVVATRGRCEAIKRSHTATGNVYKCCDCYCDNQGKCAPARSGEARERVELSTRCVCVCWFNNFLII